MKNALAAMILCTSFIMTGCGGGKTGDTDGGNQTADTKVQWIMPSNAEQLKGYSSLVKKFNEEKGYHMEVLGSSYGDMYPKLQAMMAAKQVPEVNAFSTEFVPWASKGAMMPLDDYITNAQFNLEEYDSKMVDSMRWDGKLWEIPFSGSTNVLFYNKDLFDKAQVDYPAHDWNADDWTTDDFLEMAQKLTLDKNGKNAAQEGFDPGNIVQYGIGGMASMWCAPWYFGGDITDEAGEKYIGNNENTAKGLQFVADLSLKYHVMPNQQQSEALSAGGNIFMTNKVAMSIDGTWAVSNIQNVPFKWDIAATPKGSNHSVVLYTDGLGVGGSSKNPDGGWEFIDWLYTNEENYLALLESNSQYMTIPARIDVKDKVSDLLKKQFPDIDVDVMFQAITIPDAKPVYMRYNENWNKLSTLLNNELYDPINSGDKTAEQALNDIASEAQKILDSK